MSATSSIQPFGGKRYEKPDNVKASMYVAMADLPAVKQLPIMALRVKAHRQLPLAIHYFAVVAL